MREGAENKKQVDFTTPGIKIITYASAKGLFSSIRFSSLSSNMSMAIQGR